MMRRLRRFELLSRFDVPCLASVNGAPRSSTAPEPVQPEIHLGPLTLQTFGIMFALGFLAAGALVARRLEEWGKPRDWAYELVLCALVGGLVGARLDFIIENYDSVKDDLLGNLFSGSGLVWYGGAIGGAIGVACGPGAEEC